MENTTKTFHDIRHKSNLCLQILLWMNIYVFVAWTIIYICSNVNTCGKTYGFLKIIGLTVAVLAECFRLYMGYSGNLRSKPTDLAIFLTIIPLIQLPAILCLAISTHTIPIYAASTILLMMMLLEFILGIFTWRTLSYHQTNLYRLKLEMALSSKSNSHGRKSTS